MGNSIVGLRDIVPLAIYCLRRFRHRLISLLLRIDDQRIRSHFARAEHWLRTQDTSVWAEDRRAARLRNLDHLHDYWVRGQFPRNEKRTAWRAPIFIDAEGRACAVASLLIESGGASLATRIAETANYAVVKEMDFLDLGDWVAHSGFTLDELARVQCGYPWTEMLLLVTLTFFLMGIVLFFTLTQNPIAPNLNSWIALCMAGLIIFIALPRSIIDYVKTRHKMEFFALPAFLSTVAFLPSTLILLLTLLAGPSANPITALLCAFNILMLPISWGGLILTQFTRQQAAKAQRQALRRQSH